jgi:hypothetical protein
VGLVDDLNRRLVFANVDFSRAIAVRGDPRMIFTSPPHRSQVKSRAYSTRWSADRRLRNSSSPQDGQTNIHLVISDDYVFVYMTLGSA